MLCIHYAVAFSIFNFVSKSKMKNQRASIDAVNIIANVAFRSDK